MVKAENTEKQRKVIKSPHFGQLEITHDLIYHFDDGIYGFEDLTEFVIVSEERTDPFKWLLAVEKPELSFPLIDPWYIDNKYNPGKNYMSDSYAVYVIVTLKNEEGNISANLKAPIVFELKELTGQQLILTSDKYSTNFVLPLKK